MNTPFLKHVARRLYHAPLILESIISMLSETELDLNEGESTRTIRHILAHLNNMERNCWLQNIEIIFNGEDNETFFGLSDSQSKELLDWKGEDLIQTFKNQRFMNLSALKEFNIEKKHLTKLTTYPTLGKITLKEALSTWITHDLDQVYQILRCLCYQSRLDVGPLKKYLEILSQNY